MAWGGKVGGLKERTSGGDQGGSQRAKKSRSRREKKKTMRNHRTTGDGKHKTGDKTKVQKAWIGVCC